ncbi:C4-dicarboxylate ABC transporter substrate-binding protein [Actibacterium sp. 188UL27-1]|uniref:C4-dicarboxylate ABC transporter substrate-binding protein n=1 Tax=Actibacterium sp. 188UL27-1 TaxID=2786961 RepID=UPI00195627ED|nr:C4-dicarboxylate ABC transporter substrate-binding protein [Actibacterium sp. 188UL27-1]MBM7066361.1 C4-dicarboxylate ABC transporter substrate-binding protein [Actibacterium sp. 188UL27-1]
MRKYLSRAALAALAISFASDAIAVEWDVSLWGKRRAFTEHLEKLAELVSAKTNGEFTLNLSYGGLSGSRENLDGIAAGSFQMAQFCAGYHPAKNPTITVLELPFLGVDSLELEVEVSRALYNHPAVVADMDRWNATLLMPSPQPQNNFVGAGEPPENLYGLRNIKIRAVGGVAEAVRVLRSEPISIPAPQVRDALETGAVQAVAFAPHAHMSFGTLENATWWTTNLNPGTTNCPVVVNTGALEGLSPAHREALLSSTEEALEHYVFNYTNVTMRQWEPLLRSKGIQRVDFNDTALDILREASTRTAIAAWIEENNARGVPSEELLELVSTTIEASKKRR